MRVAWIVTNSRVSPQEVEPWIEGRPFLKEADWEYYADRVAQTLARVTEVFDWDAAALLRGSHQRRLATPNRGPEEGGAGPRRPSTPRSPTSRNPGGGQRTGT